MLISDWIFQHFKDMGLKHIFLVPGGEIDPLVESLGKTMTPIPIVACHEEGAGFMADGYARTSREEIGVSLTIGAPGAGNSLPAALAASSDRSSVLFMTGGSPLQWMGLASFQESDQEGTNDSAFFRPTVRFSQTITEKEMTLRVFQEALAEMRTNVPGPVHISLPVTIQTSQVTFKEKLKIPEKLRSIDFKKVRALSKDLFAKNQKILFLIGRGAQLSQSREPLLAFIETFHIPFATTFSAKGYLPEDHPLALGMFGYAGNKRAITTFIDEDVDVIFVLGSSLNQRDSLFWDKTLTKKKILIQVDCDSFMIGRNYPVDDAILGDIKTLFDYWMTEKETLLNDLKNTSHVRQEWNKNVLQKISLFYDEENLTSTQIPIHPARIMGAMNKILPDNTLLFIDSGAHRAFAGHYWFCKGERSVCSATRIGPMGWAIPASIGGKLAQPNRTVVTITGDGCMRMHGIEIATAARHKIPVIFIVSNNNALGNVYLRMLKANPGAIELTSLSHIDWVQFAQSLGGDGIHVEKPDELENAIEKGLSSSLPFVIDVTSDPKAETPVAPFDEAKNLFLYDSL